MALLELHADVSGKRSIAEDLAKFDQRARDLAKKILDKAADRAVILAREYAPFEHGDLKARIHRTRVAANSDGGVQVHVLAARSVIQHEDLTLRHEHGGGPKFIEKAVLAVGPDIPHDLEEGLPGLVK